MPSLDNQPWSPARVPKISWKENDTPFSLETGDIYFSKTDGMNETQHYFLNNNNLPHRWESFSRDRFYVGELGFGSGLNFLMTWFTWSKAPKPKPKLSYYSVDLHPMSLKDLKKAVRGHPELSYFADQLIEKYPPPIKGQHRIIFDEGKINLDLWWSAAEDMCDNLASYEIPFMDAWYLDGFAPKLNPSMWSLRIMQSIARCSRIDASFGTFSSAGIVRRTLEEAGFKVEKVPGFKKKRDCYKGKLLRRPEKNSELVPWDICEDNEIKYNQAIVLGAGLAGAHAASALRKRGIAVEVIDQGPIAGGASGNAQGVLYARLSSKHSALTDFSLQALIFSSSVYAGMFKTQALKDGSDGEICGSFIASTENKDLLYLRKVLENYLEIGEVLNHKEASQRLGVDVLKNGYWLSKSGWMHPPSICKALLDTPGITTTPNCGKLTVTTQGDNWVIKGQGNFERKTDLLILAAGAKCRDFLGLDWLPLRANIGQTTQIASNGELKQLKAVYCHNGYITPARFNEHCVGSTYRLNETNTVELTEDNKTNIENLKVALPNITSSSLSEENLRGWVGMRCASPDYLPIVGPIPNQTEFFKTYEDLSKNANLQISRKVPVCPGLYISTAHGSRGLTYAALSGEIIASSIFGEPPPVSRRLLRAISPSRFLVRKIIKAKS